MLVEKQTHLDPNSKSTGRKLLGDSFVLGKRSSGSGGECFVVVAKVCVRFDPIKTNKSPNKGGIMHEVVNVVGWLFSGSRTRS